MFSQQRMNPFGVYLAKEDYIIYECPWRYNGLGWHLVSLLCLFCFLPNIKLEVKNFIFIPEEEKILNFF